MLIECSKAPRFGSAVRRTKLSVNVCLLTLPCRRDDKTRPFRVRTGWTAITTRGIRSIVFVGSPREAKALHP